MVRNYTSVVYLCPHCLKAGKERLYAFDYSGKFMFGIRCKFCGKTVAHIQKNGKTNYEVYSVCPLCTERHDYDISVHKFWQTDFIELLCPEFEDDHLIIGSDEFLRDDEVYSFFSNCEEDHKK